MGVVAVVQVFFTCTRCAPRCTHLSFFAEGSHVVSPSTARTGFGLGSRTLFELSDLDSLVVAPTASPGTEPFHSLVYFRPVKEKRKGRQLMEHMRGARNGDDRKTKEPWRP